MTTYNLTIENEEGVSLADASGSLKVVTLAYNEANIPGQDGEITVTLTETYGINGNMVGEKPLISLTSDAETVDAVAERRFKLLKKTDPDVPARKPRKSKGATETNTSGNAEGVSINDDNTTAEVAQY